MDATQLSLLLTARFQSNTKSSLQFGEDGASGDTSFAELLKKRALEQADLQRQIELDRQNWRSQPSSYAASRPPSTTNAAAAANDPVRGSNDGDKRPTKANTRGESSAQTEPQHGSVKGHAAQDSSNSQENSAAPASRKTAKTKDSPADDSEAAGAQPVPANANTADTTKPALQADQSADDGTSGNGQQGQGQDQGQNQASGQDGSDGAQGGGQQAQQQAADGLALANSIQGTVLAGLMMGQAPAAGGANSAQATTGLGPVGLTAAGGKGVAGTGLDTAMAAQANAAAAAQGAPVPGAVLPDTAPAAAAASAVGLDNTATQPLLQGAAAPSQTRAGAQELATAFATIVAKNAQSAAPAADNAHISIVKTDSSPQMPKPLVKIGSDHATFSPAEPTEAAAAETGPAETSPQAATAGFGTDFDADDYSSSDLRTFSSYSPLLAGGSLAIAGRQADALTALRQQLAGASIQDQVAIHMQRAIKDSADKISIQLSPTELGRIHVKMSVDDDKNVTAAITVERPATLDLLQRDTKALERALQEAGLKTDSGSLSFSLQRGNQGDSSDTPGWGQGNGRRVGSSGQENSATLAEVSSAAAGNEVDTANGLVNVAV